MEQIFNLSSGHVLFIQDSSEATFDYTIYSKPSLNDIDGGVYGEEIYTDASITIDVARTVLKEACRDCPKLSNAIHPETVQIELATDIDCDTLREIEDRNLQAVLLLRKHEEHRISSKALNDSLAKLFAKDPERLGSWLAEKSVKPN